MRQPPRDLIHHSDRGSQYCSHGYQKLLTANGMLSSMSGKGNCYDNAMVETVFKTIKSELVWRTSFQTRQQAKNALGKYIDGSTIHAGVIQHWGTNRPSNLRLK